MIAPLMEPVPPPLYGGTERVVSALTEELVQRGHNVTLFASGDSQTAAELVATVPRGLRLDDRIKDYLACTIVQLGDVYRRAAQFDIIHNHTDYLAFPFAGLSSTPTLTTTHGRLDLHEVLEVYRHYPDQALVSISNSQRRPLPAARWLATAYHGIDLAAFHLRPEPGNYLVFLGRICPEKRPDRAIVLAREVGMQLVLAAKVDPADQGYYETVIAPLLRSHPGAEYIGEVDEAQKDALLGGALAYLFPIDWPEPFGLTMVEAMATGTPVIAWRGGSVEEVVVNGVTGFICDGMQAMVDAIGRVGSIDRRACRAHVARQFSIAQMADGYERVYEALLDARGEPSLEADTALQRRRSASSHATLLWSGAEGQAGASAPDAVEPAVRAGGR